MTDAVVIGSSDPVLREIAELRDLFHRRLVNDRAKAQAIGTLQEQAEFLRDGMSRAVVAPLMRDLLTLHDRVSMQGDDMAQSVAAELQGIFVRYGVRELPPSADAGPRPFDPSIHHCLATEPSEDMPANTVVRTIRQGYLLGDLLLRPESVVVATQPSNEQNPEAGESGSEAS